MENQLIEKKLEKIRLLTKEMLDNANNDQWDNVVKLEQARDKLLRQLSNNQTFEPLEIALVKQIYELNQHVEHLVEKHIEQLVVDFKQTNQGRKAANAYRKTIRSR